MIDVRAAVADDAMAVAEVAVRSWREAYRDLIDRSYLEELRPEDRASRYDFATTDAGHPRTLVAVDGAVICGHITVGRSRDDDMVGCGEVWALYVDPLRWRSGTGRALLAAGCDHLSNAGYTRAHLWVISANLRARRFYESTGWRADGRERVESIGGSSVHEVGYLTDLDVRQR